MDSTRSEARKCEATKSVQRSWTHEVDFATKSVQRSWTHEVDFATKSRAKRAEGEVERGNHLQRIHDRDKRKVFYPAQRGKQNPAENETQFRFSCRGVRNAASPRKKP